MVEQTYVGECHGDAILVTGIYHMVVTDATACLCNILYAALMSTLDIVAEGEEGI